MPIRSFSLKDGTVVPNPYDQDRANPGRTIYPEPMRMAEQGWVHNTPSESVQRREDHVTDEELETAREWLRHVEAGRIGGPR
jgi:hypothetical protein